jgi:RNA polymerase sigma-70 factor (ECF subfamily)
MRFHGRPPRGSGHAGRVRLTSPARPEDEALIERCRARDPAALETLLRRHTRPLSALLRRLAGRTADVEDLLQNTLVAAVQAFPSFRGESSVDTWLAAIAVRVASAHLCGPERRRRRVLVAIDDADVSAEPAAREPGADRRLETRRLLDRTFRLLDRVGPRQRLAFVLHIVEGYSIEEVARMTSSSAVATKSRVFWARRRLLRNARRDPALAELVRETAADPR